MLPALLVLFAKKTSPFVRLVNFKFKFGLNSLLIGLDFSKIILDILSLSKTSCFPRLQLESIINKKKI